MIKCTWCGSPAEERDIIAGAELERMKVMWQKSMKVYEQALANGRTSNPNAIASVEQTILELKRSLQADPVAKCGSCRAQAEAFAGTFEKKSSKDGYIDLDKMKEKGERFEKGWWTEQAINRIKRGY